MTLQAIWLRLGLAACGLASLMACQTPTAQAPSGGGTAPPPRSAPAPVVPQVERSARSIELERHYARVQADLLSQGLLRTDGGGPDTPFTARMLADNFTRIALYDEYTSQNGALIARTTQSRLRKWERPVRLGLIYGPSIPDAKKRKDSATLSGYARRLARATGHAVSINAAKANFHVAILHEDDRRAFGPKLRQLVPGIGETAVRTVENMPRSTFCLVFVFAPDDRSPYTRAVAVIRGEHPDLLRTSCIHEEVAQGLGLANDSPQARPSIFNDDEEFALLTTHDEMLLRILYNPALRTGMSEAEATPIVRSLAERMKGGS